MIEVCRFLGCRTVVRKVRGSRIDVLAGKDVNWSEAVTENEAPYADAEF